MKNFSSRELIEILNKFGWTLTGVTGSHHQLKHPNHPKVVTVPHPKKNIPIGTMLQIIKSAELSAFFRKLSMGVRSTIPFALLFLLDEMAHAENNNAFPTIDPRQIPQNLSITNIMDTVVVVDPHIKPNKIHTDFLYRGDGRLPTNIFSEGFSARGSNPSVFNHFLGNSESGYIATSYSKKVAEKFAKSVAKPDRTARSAESRAAVYEINPQQNAIDVETFLHQKKSDLLSKNDKIKLRYEQERAVASKINARDVKGAWIVSVKENAKHTQSVTVDHYVSNPRYIKPTHFKITYGANLLGSTLTIAAATGDAIYLYRSYQNDKKSGNYAKSIDAGAGIIAGWSAAIPASKLAGMISATQCAPLGPIASVACGFVGSAVGGTAAYFTGQSLGTYGAKKLRTTIGYGSTQKRQSQPTVNFSPETSFESLSDSIQGQSSLLVLKRDKAEEKLNLYFEKSLPKKSAKQSATATLKKITDYFKESLREEKSPNKKLKDALLKDLHTHVTDPETHNLMHEFIDETDKLVHVAKPFLKDFQTQQGRFSALERLGNLRYVRSEIGGIQEGFYAVATLGTVLHSPVLTKTAQFGFALSNVALRVTDVMAHSAMKTLGAAGIMAVTGNWIGLGTAVLGLILPFLNSGPSEHQIMMGFLEKAFKHVDQRFDHLEKQMDGMREEARAQYKSLYENIKVLYEQGCPK